MNPFPYLHVHSYYTLLGATASLEQLTQRAADEGMTPVFVSSAQQRGAGLNALRLTPAPKNIELFSE